MDQLSKIECFAAYLFPTAPFGKQILYWMSCDKNTPHVPFVPCPKEIFDSFITFYTGDPTDNPLKFHDRNGEEIVVTKRGVGTSSVAAFKTAINYLHNLAGMLTESPALEVSIQERLNAFNKLNASPVGEESADPAKYLPRMYHACHVADKKSTQLAKARNWW